MKYDDLDFSQVDDELMMLFLLDDFIIAEKWWGYIPIIPSKRMN